MKTEPQNHRTTLSRLRSSKGAGLAEYGILVGLLGTASIAAVYSQGHKVHDIFTGASHSLTSHGLNAGGSGGAVAVVDPFKNVDQTDWLVGTPNDDGALTITNEPGAKGLAGNDVIKGTTAAEGFIGGPGDDTINGGGGNDTFYFATGEGHDTVSNYSSSASGDSVNFTDVASTDVTASRNGYNLTLTIDATGDSVTLKNFGTNNYRDWIGSYVFSDKTLSLQDMRDKSDEDQKPTGKVYGTKMTDNYVVQQGDGSYDVSDTGGTDTVSFDGLASTDVKFYSNSPQDLIVTLPNSDTIKYLGDFSGWSYKRVENLAFSDKTFSFQESIDKMDQDSKETGTIYGTDYNDHYTLAANDLDHKIYEGGGTDTMTFDGYSSSDVLFKTNSAHDMIMTVPGGPTATLGRGYDSFNYKYIDSFIFNDKTLTRQDAIDKMDQDMKPFGYIWGSESNDHYTMTDADPDYSIRDTGGTNTLKLSGMVADGVKFHNTSSGDLVITGSGNNKTTVVGQWNGFTYYQLYQFIFDDVTLSSAEAVWKMDEDDKSSGVVYGSPYADHYTFNSMDQDYTIYEDSGTDQITFSEPFSAYTLMYSQNGNDLYIIGNSGNQLTIYGQNSSWSYRWIENFIFADGTRTRADIQGYCSQSNGAGGGMCDFH